MFKLSVLTKYPIKNNMGTGNSFHNLTEKLHKESQTYLSLYDFVIPIMGIFVILINFSVVVSSGLLLKKGVEPRFTYLFLGNVALADLITGISVTFGQLFPKKYTNSEICELHLGMIISSTLASIYSVGLLAIDRFLYIVYGLKYFKWINIRRVRTLIAITWILAITVGILPLTGWNGESQNGKICWFITVAPDELILITICVGVVPIITVLILYTIILRNAIIKITHIQNSLASITTVSEQLAAMEQLRMFRGTVEQPMKRTVLRRKMSTTRIPNKWKAIKVVLFTTTTFLVTWAPYFVACAMYVYRQCRVEEDDSCKNLRLLIASPLAILGFTNSLVNPIIYAWWHNGFRTFVRTRIRKLWG